MVDYLKLIREHQDFWSTMYGEQKWKEISEEITTKNPDEILDSLTKVLRWYEENEFTEISMFSKVGDVDPKPFFLEKWLYQTKRPFDDIKESVNLYRETFDKKIKESLPCCTISASFSNYRNLDNIKKKNRLICIDVDRFTKKKRKKSNHCIDMQLVKEMFQQHPSTLYVGFSCSGDGVYAVLRIFDSEKLNEYFEFFKDKLATIGINIDDSCKDYTRLRFISVDEESYFNPNAKFYKIPEIKKNDFNNENSKDFKDNHEKVEKLCQILESTMVDITSSYDDWYKIGAALYNEFGESGVSFYHRISKFHPDYSIKECERKFTNCKKVKGVKINTLFYIASSYGVRY